MTQLSLTAHLSVYANRCLNLRGQAEFCRLCLDGCPQNAIAFTDAGINFDPARCNECALCVCDCPTEVFSHDAFAPIDFIHSVKGKTELDICCQAADSNQREPDTVPIPCHGLLDDRLLVGLHSIGVERLNLHGLNRCDGCQSRVGGRRLTQTVESASATLKTHFPSLHSASKREVISSTILDENIAATKLSEEPMDRRKFLDDTLNGAVNVVAFAALTSLPEQLLQNQSVGNDLIASGQNECMVKQIPQSHQLALLSLQNSEISTAITAWFHEVREHGSCDACGICSLICPTGALLTDDSELSVQLNHRPSACIGCGLCSLLCPEQALQLQVVHDDATIMDAKTRTLFRCEKLKCRSCGSNFTHLGSADLCRSCESENAIRDQWIGEVS
ncbi:MAG: 4Fe-4S dicluster domain-containing protein [Mariprofundaceae bacterium]